MQVHDAPQLPLTPLRRALAGAGAAMFAAQTAGAIVAAPRTTGADASAGWLLALWAGCVVWSTVAALLIVRQADLPDVATASFVITIAACAAFALSAALAARDTAAEVNLVDALFLGVTVGGLTSLLVGGLAMGVARLLRLPTTEALRAER
jgi:hypothetical protein